MTTPDAMETAAKARWLENFTSGPVEPLGPVLAAGEPAPSFTLVDDRGTQVELSDFWADGPALVMFWRHFGCSCGIDRAGRLASEAADYTAAGLNPVIIGQGEPERAAIYRARHNVPCPILSDPGYDVYRAYGVGQYAIEQVFYEEGDAEFFGHSHELGIDFQKKRDPERPLVDDPWRAMAEFVVGTNGIIRLAHAYQWCEDFPNPGVLIGAAVLSNEAS